jgi:hypothetical protein
MGVPSDAAVPAGDLVKRLDETNSNVAQTRTARRGEATSVGARGMRFHSGGSATFEGGGGIIVRDGGDVVVEDGGSLSAEYPSGRPATKFGPLTLESTGAPDGHGLLVQADDDSDGRDIFRAKYVNGERIVWIGQTPGSDASGAVDEFTADAVQVGIHAHGDELRLQTHHGNPVRIYGGDGVTGAADVRIATFGGGLINIQSDANGDIQALSDDRLWLFADGNLDGEANGNISLLADGTAALGGATGTFLQPASGGVSANVHMDTATGRIRYVVSSERYKTDIQNLDVDPAAVLLLQPRSWLPLPPVQQCPDWLHALHGDDECRSGEPGDQVEGPRHVGFIAEELDGLGLGAFVSRDADGLPDGIHYDRLTAAVIPVLQTQQQQIAALAERLDALEHPPEPEA